MQLESGLISRQLDREKEQRANGVARFTKAFEEAQTRGRGDETEAGLYLMKRAIEPVVEGIKKFIADAYSGKPGPKAVAAVALKDIDHHLAAYCAVTKVVAAIAVIRSRHLSAVASAVARDIELELKMAAFDQQQPGLYNAVTRRLKEQRATDIHIARVISHTVSKYGVEWDGWSANERLHIGSALVDICLEATGIATIKTVSIGGGKWAATISPTPYIVEWVNHRREQLAIARPFLLPMLVKPRRWGGVFGGGYRSDQIMRTTIVKRVSKPQREAIREAMADGSMKVAQVALNAVQETAWRINGHVLETAQRIWQSGGDMPGLPSRDDDPDPPRPAELGEKPEKGAPKPELTEEQKVALREWKWAARDIHERNIASRSKRVAVELILGSSSDLVGERAIYFPHQFDFRGRMYCRTTGLNPQGEDLTKGLLTFAEGKPLGDDAAARWLAIHGANCFGVDKVNHDQRVAWVREHSAEIEETAFDPLGRPWWRDADAPWSFLAFCHEWAGFLRDGLGHVSAVPVALDGSCNGIQHYSAMLRDPVGGAAVNLTPSDQPQDIYGRVAEEAMRRLREIANDPDSEHAWVAQGWLAFGLDRKMTKRQVMVLPYGGTQSSCREYTFEAVRDRIKAGAENPFGDELEKRTLFLAGIIWQSIGDVVIAARAAMEWLRKVARAAAKAERPLRWTTPSGFVAYQDYRATKERRIKTRVGGQLIYFTHNEDTKKIDPGRQASGSPPNFVHSMDGAALALTVERALMQHGVTSFAMIHDSYGTVAADTGKLATCLRDAFVDMYTREDILAKYRDEIAAQLPEGTTELPELPGKGDLDLELVRRSAYFFT
jgi:DNA-directed RNA polymerase